MKQQVKLSEQTGSVGSDWLEPPPGVELSAAMFWLNGKSLPNEPRPRRINACIDLGPRRRKRRERVLVSGRSLPVQVLAAER